MDDASLRRGGASSRLARVQRAYRDADNDLISTSGTGIIHYDGLGRRVMKSVDNSADWDCTYFFYHDGQRTVEVRNGSERVLNQYVWGRQYVDELVQVAINQDPEDPIEANGGHCERFFWALTDANFNVMGIVDANGNLTERYEYTPYGQRTVYSRGWNIADMNDDRKVDGTDLAIWGSESASTSRADLNGDGKVDGSDLAVWQQNYAPIGLDGDSLVTWPVLESTKGKGGGATPRVADTCPVGHQGLFEDKEFGGILHNGARMRHPVLGSFMQRDPLGYGDGTNLYQLLRSLPISGLDPKGLKRLAYTYRHQSVVAGAHSRAEANSFELMWLPLPIPVPLPSDRTVATLDDYALERETFTAAKNLLSHHGIDIAELPPPNGYFHPQVVTISEFEIRNYKVMKYTERQLDYFDIDWEEEWDWIGDIGIGADDVIVYVPGIVGLQGREIALAAHWEKYHVIAFSRKHFPRLGLHERGPILAHEILHHFLKNTINPGSGDPAHDTEGIMAPDAGRVVIAGFRTPSTELGRKTVCALKALGIEDADIEPHYRMDQRNK